jgi:3-oxoacyl-[acyl-carrier protein] reductase
MDLGLDGRVALVTGAARGIGAATAIALAREGCHLALLDSRRDDALETVAGEVAALGVEAASFLADVADFARAGATVEAVIGRMGRLDILVCNAGVTRDAISWNMTEDAWDEVLAVNLKGCFNYAHAAGPAFRRQRSGRIVAVSSINGLRGKAGQANYAASKAGLVGLCKTLARELGPAGVTVNVVAPGMIRTELTAALPERFVTAAAQEAALGTIGDPQDVACAIVFLCSDAARHVTGQVLRVDGGQYL